MDEPAGDFGDQAQRVQMADEQEAIAAALEGEEAGYVPVSPGGGDVDGLLAEPGGAEADASDDPLHGGGDGVGEDPTTEAVRLLEDDLPA